MLIAFYPTKTTKIFSLRGSFLICSLLLFIIYSDLETRTLSFKFKLNDQFRLFIIINKFK